MTIPSIDSHKGTLVIILFISPPKLPVHVLVRRKTRNDRPKIEVWRPHSLLSTQMSESRLVSSSHWIMFFRYRGFHENSTSVTLSSFSKLESRLYEVTASGIGPTRAPLFLRCIHVKVFFLDLFFKSWENTKSSPDAPTDDLRNLSSYKNS